MTEKNFIKEFKEKQGFSESLLDKQHSKAKEALDIYANNEQAMQGGDNKARQMVMINKTKAYIDSVAGFMIQNRRRAKYEANVENDEEQELYSFYLNGVSEYIRANAFADQIESVQDKQMLITGYGAIETALVFGDEGASRNPNGEIIFEPIPYNQIYWDPTARWSNLLDANYLYRCKKYPIEEAKELFNADNNDFMSAPANNENYEYYPQGGIYTAISDGVQPDSQNMVNVYNYQYWEREKYYRVTNPIKAIAQINPEIAFNLEQGLMQKVQMLKQQMGDEQQPDLFSLDFSNSILTMDKKLFNIFGEELGSLGIPLDYDTAYRKCFYTAILSDNTVFDKFKSIDQQGFSIKIKTGDYNDTEKTWFGLMDVMKNPLMLSNKILTELLRIVASQAKSGILYEEGAVVDERNLEANYARPDASIKLNPNGLNKIRPKNEGYSPNGYDNLLNLVDNYIATVPGIDPSFLGSSENKLETAALQRQRVKQVTTVLASYFDSITLYQKDMARMMISYIRELATINPDRNIRLVNEEGVASRVKIDPSYMVDEYDVVIEEAPESQTEREERAQMLMGYADKLALTGQNIYDTILTELPISESMKKKINDKLNPEMSPEQAQAAQQQQELQQQAALIELEKSQAEVEKLRAETAAKISEAEQKPESATNADLLKAKELDLKERDLILQEQIAEKKLQLESQKNNVDAVINANRVLNERNKIAADVESKQEVEAFKDTRQDMQVPNDINELLSSVPMAAVDRLRNEPDTAVDFNIAFGNGQDLAGLILQNAKQ